ncbi:MAG: transporter related [Herbinix sp.]|jgi:ATP-binding cassette subfamily B protein|nr:transporter related [Herbinix sp.]
MKNFIKNLKDIIFLIRPFWKYGKFHMVISLIIYIFIIPLNAIASVLFTQSVIDAVATGASFTDVLVIIFRFLLILFFTVIIQNAFDSLYNEAKMVAITQKINADIYSKVLKTDYKYFDNPEFYNNYSWAINEYAGKASEARLLLLNICRSISTIISMTTIIAILGPLLIVITIIEMCITILFEMKRNKLGISKREETMPMDRQLGYVHRIFYQREYAADIRSTNLKQFLYEIYDDNGSKKIFIIKKYAKRILLWLYAQNFIGIIYNAAIMAYISYSLIVSKKIVGIGKFMSLITANTQLITSLYGFFGFFSQANNLSLYAQKINNFFKTESKIEANVSSQLLDVEKKTAFKVEFKNVCFSYENSGFSLSNINFVIKPKEKIAIVGANGVGKTTLVKLLLRLYDVTEGMILINDIPIQNYNIHLLRNDIGVAFQTPNTYAISFLNNMQLYRTLNSYEVDSIMEKFDLKNVINKSKATIQTDITKEFDDNGIILSGGEAQKLGLSRIMKSDFGLLLLDEPSSALDPISEYEFMKLLHDRANSSTSIIIAHRLSTVRNSDRIYVMDDGKIIETGTHDQLIALKGKYFEMFEKQSEHYIN